VTGGTSVVHLLVGDVTETFCDRLTAEQAKVALQFYPDFSDAWDDWCQENDDVAPAGTS